MSDRRTQENNFNIITGNFFFKLGISNDSDNNSIIHTEKESLIADFQTIKLENGDCCIVSYFEDFKNIHLCKAVKDCKNSSSYESHNLPIVLETMSSNGK